jgi:hypothetical protein
MGTLRGDNGGERPPEGGGVPGLPPEWGLIVIPDDASELDDEAVALRREWRRAARINRWRQRLGLAPLPASRPPSASLGLPLLIMSIAILATLTSLFALAWPNHAGTVRGATRGAPATGPSARTAGVSPGPVLADLTLVDATATPVRLRDTLPAVILLVDGCECGPLATAVADAAPATVTVLVVARATPALPSRPSGPAARTRALADPEGRLWAAYGPVATATAGSAGPVGATPGSAGGVRGSAIALLVERGGGIVRAAQAVTGAGELRSDLARLG